MFHNERIDAFRKRHNDLFYAVFRVLIGLLFLQHGLQKVFGLFTDNGPQELFSFMWAVGVIEAIGGILIVLGLFTSVTALVMSIVMIGAFATAHFSLANPIPIMNRGELALVYLAAFLYIIFEGGGKYSLDTKLCERCAAK